jgi:ATP-dependent 26S proteasome regulatory subunit
MLSLPLGPDVSAVWLAECTEGFSPADITTALRRAAVQAAVRPELHQRVVLQDLRRAIERIREAKEEVGSHARGPKAVTSEVLPDGVVQDGGSSTG